MSAKKAKQVSAFRWLIVLVSALDLLAGTAFGILDSLNDYHLVQFRQRRDLDAIADKTQHAFVHSPSEEEMEVRFHAYDQHFHAKLKRSTDILRVREGGKVEEKRSLLYEGHLLDDRTGKRIPGSGIFGYQTGHGFAGTMHHNGQVYQLERLRSDAELKTEHRQQHGEHPYTVVYRSRDSKPIQLPDSSPAVRLHGDRPVREKSKATTCPPQPRYSYYNKYCSLELVGHESINKGYFHAEEVRQEFESLAKLVGYKLQNSDIDG